MGLLDRYTSTLLDYRWWVVGLATLVMLAMTAGAQFLTVSNDYRILFSDDNPQLMAFDALEATYTESYNLLIAVAVQEGSVFEPATLDAVESLTEAVWQLPYSSRVTSLTNYSHSEADGDDLVVAPLVEDALSMDAAALERVEAIALGDADIAGRLVSRDGRVASVVVDFVLADNPDQQVIEITGTLQGILDEARTAHPGLGYYTTGFVVQNQAFSEATQDDLETLLPIVFVVIVGLSAILLRSIAGTVAIVAIVMFAVNSTMGSAGWSGVLISPTNSGIPVIVMVIAIADSIHIISNVLQGLQRGLDKHAAILESMRINAYPVFLTSLTTAIGFLTLNTSDSPPFHVLGNWVAFGVLCAFVYSMTFLPALLSVLPLRSAGAQPRSSALMEGLAEFVVTRHKQLFWVVALAAAVLITGVPRIELGDNLVEFFDERYEFRRDADFITQNLTGLDKLEYSLQSGREGGITDPAYLQKVEAFAEWYRTQPGVTHVQAFSDIMKRLNKNMHGDDPAFERLPEDAALAAQYLLLYELSIPFGSDLNDRIDVAKSATRMSVTIENASSRDLRDLDARAQAWLEAESPGLAGEASGISMIFAHMSDRNVSSMMVGIIGAMILISVLLIAVFRSVRIGLISLLPNFVPALMSFGLWGHLVGQIGLVSTVVIAISFGIVVDDTIHFLSKYLKARREGEAAPDSVRYAFRTTGQALWVTTAVLVAGFLVFTASGFQLSWVLGLMVAITVSFALAADFLLLPALLMFADRKTS
ncbi:MAG: MMPL family transporter [Proteobacteria bacterium]|nr:MMPL family transporter [Pseudomonadota bacterium]